MLTKPGFRLEPADILLCVNDRTDIFSRIYRGAIGRYEHVSMYIGTFCDIPMLYESDGRGVVLQNVAHQTGRPVVVMRPLIEWKYKHSVVATAINIASQDSSHYDYLAIMHSAIPRVIKEKLPFLPIPSRYIRDDVMICSEACAETFWRRNILVLPKTVIPIPGDFFDSPILEYAYEGKLMEDIVG